MLKTSTGALLCGALVAVGTACNGKDTQNSIQTRHEWVEGDDFRLRIGVFPSEELSAEPILVVAIHGDAPFTKPDYQYKFAEEVARIHADIIAVGLLRPGYTDPAGNRSDGERGLNVGDNWHARNTDAIASAIQHLRRRWNCRKAVVAGHSGGAALTANILGRHPKVIDSALLVSCPSDVNEWRAHMYDFTGEEAFAGKLDSLSPYDQMADIPENTSITLIVGNLDKITPPRLSRNYLNRAQSLGKNATLVQLPRKGHEIFLDTIVFEELAKLMN